jgi:DNA-directed RNA polymerase subunit M/transcription elongation factor TFIIS
MFNEIYVKFFEIMPDEPRNSHRAVLHLNLFYSIMVGNELVDRYDRRDSRVNEMIAEDEAKDDQVAIARLSAEPTCEHCEKTGLRLTEKMLHHRSSFDEPEEVLFMLNCTGCQKNSAVWEDGMVLDRNTYCPKCNAVMDEKDKRGDKTITTFYSCPSCGHKYNYKLDFNPKEEKLDPDFESDRRLFCLHDEKIRQEIRDAKWRSEEMARFGREHKEKEANKHIYDAIAKIKKLKIPELPSILSPVLEKAGYIEFNLDKPEFGKFVIVGFNCLDSKSDRSDYDSRKTLQKLIRKALEGTNWRIMNEGVSYRLGYLNGKLRAYEREEDIKELVRKSLSVKSQN